MSVVGFRKRLGLLSNGVAMIRNDCTPEMVRRKKHDNRDITHDCDARRERRAQCRRRRTMSGRRKAARAKPRDEIPYDRLTPDVIATAVERVGFETTGSILALGSYENRVYQMGVRGVDERDGFVVAKFYRPGRWSTDAILEEHEFALELAGQEIPVGAPLVHDGASLHE